MKKSSEYNRTMIMTHKGALEGHLKESITEMVNGEYPFSIDLSLNKGYTKLTYIEPIYDEEDKLSKVLVTKDYFDFDGLEYSDPFNLDELNLDELYWLWNYLDETAK